MKKLKLSLFFVTFLFAFLFISHTQEINQEDFIRIALWAEIDAYPGTYPAEGELKPSDNPFDYPRERLKALSTFILEGMTYGWDFEYTPSDKLRGVDEYFELIPVKKFDKSFGKVTWTNPWIADNNIWVWMDFTRTDAMKQYWRMWQSVNYKKIKGLGHGALSKGFDGIKEAYEEGIKLAVREYVRRIKKNKPKEITGRILLTGEPRLYADSGKYAVDLDFFLELDKIVQYNQF